MVRNLLLVVILGAVSALSQTVATPKAPTKKSAKAPASTKKTSTPASAAASEVAPGQAVITLQGLCPGTAASKAACKTVITRAQFEKILNAVAPPGQVVPPAARLNLAKAYVQLLTVAEAGRKAGVERDPRFQETLKLDRLRTTAEFYQRKLQDQYRNASGQEIDSYYKQHQAEFEQVKLRRIYIPNANPQADAQKETAEAKQAFAKKAEQTANEIQARAAKGEDPDKLEKEALTSLGITITPPSTDLGNRTRQMLPPQDAETIFALQPGGVSKLVTSPSGFAIYKVESKSTMPLDQAKPEISNELLSAKMKQILSSVNVDLSNKYFGASSTPAPPAGSTPPATPPRTPAPK